MTGLANAVEHMLHDPRLCLRDRAVIGLLRNTGARASEITGMTVGGYRAFTRDGILGEALVVNKGSGGIAEKRLYFHEAVGLQRTLLRYLREERRRWDPEDRTRLADLPDEAPFFLTERGTPYSYETFKWHWRKVFPAARKRCPIDFSPHDLRHLLVTELLVRARAEWDPHSPEYADVKRGLVDLFAWADPTTIELYDHSVDRAAALGLLGAWQRAIAERAAKPVRRAPALPAHETFHVHEPDDTLTQGVDLVDHSDLSGAAAVATQPLAGREGEPSEEPKREGEEEDASGLRQGGQGGAPAGAPASASVPCIPQASSESGAPRATVSPTTSTTSSGSAGAGSAPEPCECG
jgi:hypothetical protein